jgi:hypothetical protein
MGKKIGKCGWLVSEGRLLGTVLPEIAIFGLKTAVVARGWSP